MDADLKSPIVAVKCSRCGAACIRCTCAPCPSCDGMICVTCDIRTDPFPADTHEISRDTLSILGVRWDAPLPQHGGPRRCEPKKIDPLLIVGLGCEFDEYRARVADIPEPSEMVKAICTAFGTVAAGLVAVSCAVIFAGAVVFARELPR